MSTQIFDRSDRIWAKKIQARLVACYESGAALRTRIAQLEAVVEAARTYNAHLAKAVEFWRERGDEKYVDAWRSAQESFADVRKALEQKQTP